MKVLNVIFKLCLLSMLIFICYTIIVKDDSSYEGERTKYLETQMLNYQHKLDSVMNINFNKFEVSMQKQQELMDKIDAQSGLIKDAANSISGEKYKLKNSTNDENILYFRNYIEHSTSK